MKRVADTSRTSAAHHADMLSCADTHGIALFPHNRLLMHSEGLGWRNLYASLAVENPWQAVLPAIDHYGLAYCIGHTALVSRALDGERTRSAELRPRLFDVVPTRMRSQWDLRGSPEILLIYLSAPLMAQTAAQVFQRDLRGIDIPPGLGFADGLLEQLALAVLGELRKGEGSNPIYVDTLAHAMAARLLQGATDPAIGAKPAVATPARNLAGPALRRALDYIDAALDQNLSIEKLAEIAGVSPLHFARAFRRQHGIAPHQFILARRIERAKQLLMNADRPLVDIALDTGFASQSHFSTAFKKIAGTTPMEFRRRA